MTRSEQKALMTTKRNLLIILSDLDAMDKNNDKEIEKLLKHINYIDDRLNYGKQPKK